MESAPEFLRRYGKYESKKQVSKRTINNPAAEIGKSSRTRISGEAKRLREPYGIGSLAAFPTRNDYHVLTLQVTTMY